MIFFDTNLIGLKVGLWGEIREWMGLIMLGWKVLNLDKTSNTHVAQAPQ